MRYSWKWNRLIRCEFYVWDLWTHAQSSNHPDDWTAMPCIPPHIAARTLARLEQEREIEQFNKQIEEALDLIERLSKLLEGKAF